MIIQRKEKQPESYERYVYLQGNKYRDRIDKIKENNAQRTRAFERVFSKAKSFLKQGRVLCLGARTGCEVRAARRVIHPESIGIDLYPAPEKDEVIYGDWHNIPFKDGSFSNVFTNSLDHCYDPDKMISEIFRVLEPDGRFFFRTMIKEDLRLREDKDAFLQQKIEGSMDFLFWDTGKDLARYFESFGFRLVKKWSDKRWHSFILIKEE